MKYTAEEVRAMAKMVGDEFSPHAGSMLTAYAERIKADEGAVPFGYAYRYADGVKLGGSGRERNGMRPTETIPLFAHPPAQVEPTEAVLNKAVEVFLSVAPEWNDYLVKDGMRATLRTVWPNPPAQAAQGEANPGRCKACGRATRAVCDGLDGNGLGCTNAPPIDLAAVRKVIAHLRHFDSPYTRGLADKLEAAIKGEPS